MHRETILQIYEFLNEKAENLRNLATSLEPFLQEQFSPEAVEEVENIDQEITYLEQELQNFRMLIDESLP